MKPRSSIPVPTHGGEPSRGGDVRPGTFPSLKVRAGLSRVLAAARRLDDSWLGDVLGALSIFAIGYLCLVAAWVLQ